MLTGLAVLRLTGVVLTAAAVAIVAAVAAVATVAAYGASGSCVDDDDDEDDDNDVIGINVIAIAGAVRDERERLEL